MTLLVLGFWLLSALRYDPPGYERYTPPEMMDDQARELAHVVRAFGHRHKLTLHYDWRLMHAAKEQVDGLAGRPNAELSLAALKASAWRQGWTDAEMSAVRVTTRQRALPKALAMELERALSDVDASSMGLAVVTEAQPADPQLPQATVVVVLSRRLVRLAPVPRTRPIQSQLTLAGTLTSRRASVVRLTASYPAGDVFDASLSVHHGRFVGSLPVGAAAGTLSVELLVDQGFGPQVAAAFPVLVQSLTQDDETQPTTLRASDAGAPQEEPLDILGHTRAPAAQDLMALVWGARQSNGLPLPQVSPNLMQAAQQHADDMAQHHFFAHVSPNKQDVTHRLKRLHEPYTHVVENIALGRTLTDAFTQWVQSPGHLQNLLDPKVDRLGVGLAPKTTDDSSGIYIVLVMSRRR